MPVAATVLNLAGIISARANPPDVPCVDDHENPTVRWVLASALIRELRGCTVVRFEELVG